MPSLELHEGHRRHQHRPEPLSDCGEHGAAAKAAKGGDPAKKLSTEEHVTALVAVYAEHGAQITRVEALRMLASGETVDKVRAELAQAVAR